MKKKQYGFKIELAEATPFMSKDAAAVAMESAVGSCKMRISDTYVMSAEVTEEPYEPEVLCGIVKTIGDDYEERCDSINGVGFNQIGDKYRGLNVRLTIEVLDDND